MVMTDEKKPVLIELAILRPKHYRRCSIKNKEGTLPTARPSDFARQEPKRR